MFYQEMQVNVVWEVSQNETLLATNTLQSPPTYM